MCCATHFIFISIRTTDNRQGIFHYTPANLFKHTYSSGLSPGRHARLFSPVCFPFDPASIIPDLLLCCAKESCCVSLRFTARCFIIPDYPRRLSVNHACWFAYVGGTHPWPALSRCAISLTPGDSHVTRRCHLTLARSVLAQRLPRLNRNNEGKVDESSEVKDFG